MSEESSASTSMMKQAKFRRLAQRRVNAIQEAFRKLGNLASPNYTYTPDQARQIFDYIDELLDECKAKFTKYRGQVSGFAFKDEAQEEAHANEARE